MAKIALQLIVFTAHYLNDSRKLHLVIDAVALHEPPDNPSGLEAYDSPVLATIRYEDPLALE